MSDFDALAKRLASGNSRRHRVENIMHVNEITRKATCAVCETIVTSTFIEDEDMPDHWTGWGECNGPKVM